MPEVKSTYNFVTAPLESEVFKPDWAEQVSHDIPFSDGECGEIELTITAKSPVFIRNGHAEGKEEFEFSHIKIDGQKRYFIPATSLKGMVRNVLEILSFSRMCQIANNRYAIRDLSSQDNPYMTSYDSSTVECGWLKEDKEGNWSIENCGKPVKISHGEIDEFFESYKTNFKETYQVEEYYPVEEVSFEKKDSISFKYQGKTFKKPKKTYNEKNKRVYKKLDNRNKNAFFKYQTLQKKTGQFYNSISLDENSGTLVFTGQSSLRNEEEETGKYNEFIFLDVQKGLLRISSEQQKDFKFIYFDHDANNISKDWEFWKAKLGKGEKIPVFFNADSETTVKHFGLAYMYKLPYEHSIHQTLPYRDYDHSGKDLAETIFGTTDKGKGMLKGRVMFSHVFSDNARPYAELKREILASPKASYYPFYIDQQHSKKDHKTYMGEDALLRGIKRYPVHQEAKSGEYSSQQKRNKDIFSEFRPLEAEAVFKGSIRFHNLRKVEIGALFSALTFHGQEDLLYHSVGSAKPLGYGKISLKIDQLHFLKTYRRGIPCCL